MNENFLKNVYLYENPEEEEAGLIPKPGELKITLLGTTLTPDRSDCYMTIYLNGRMIDGYLNQNPKICRISLLGAYYIDNPGQYKFRFNKDQKEEFVNYVTNNWDQVLKYLEYTYDALDIQINMDFYNKLKCPDYSTLETI